MKAIRIHASGGPEVIRFEDLPPPTPGPGEAVIQVAAAGVNYIDTYHRAGLYLLPLPVTLGQEGAGTVTATGPGADVQRPLALVVVFGLTTSVFLSLVVLPVLFAQLRERKVAS